MVALADTSGTIEERFGYDPYGQSRVLEGDFSNDPDGLSDYARDYRFTSREFESETGLHYFRARYYHDGLGRFIGRDPLSYIDGGSLYAGYFVPDGVDPSGTIGGAQQPPTTPCTTDQDPIIPAPDLPTFEPPIPIENPFDPLGFNNGFGSGPTNPTVPDVFPGFLEPSPNTDPQFLPPDPSGLPDWIDPTPHQEPTQIPGSPGMWYYEARPGLGPPPPPPPLPTRPINDGLTPQEWLRRRNREERDDIIQPFYDWLRSTGGVLVCR